MLRKSTTIIRRDRLTVELALVGLDPDAIAAKTPEGAA